MNPLFTGLLDLMKTKTLGDYSPNTTQAQLILAFPSIFGRLGAAYYDPWLNGDKTENMAVYLHKMTGGTSYKN